MLCIGSDAHRAHHPREPILDAGRPVPPPEIPARAEAIAAALDGAGFGPLQAPQEFGSDLLSRVHSRDYVDFLATAHERWRAATGLGPDAEATSYARAIRDQPLTEPPHVIGQLGWYSHDTDPILAGTFAAAVAAVDVALTASQAVRDGARSAYALCRPPGHHAAAESFAGYCYFNNAAVAAQQWCNAGARIAILDVDFHHGNGTQQIFYDRDDALFVSLHADPADDYPYFLGFANERGWGAGEGYTRNYPLPPATDWDAYGAALESACDVVRRYAPDALVCSLGVDTALEDPDSFRLTGDDFLRMGEAIAALNVPTVLVQEGGYALDVLGRNVVNVLRAFA